MIDPQTRDLVASSPDRREIVIAVYRLDQDDPALKHRAAEARQAAWVRLRDLILEAALADGGGLRRVRHRKGRPEIVLAGPAAAWTRFFDTHRDLAAEHTIEWRHFIPGLEIDLAPEF